MHSVTSNAVAYSFSYYEHIEFTGGKWIDGKSIYRIVLTNTSAINVGSFSWGGLQSTVQSLNIKDVIKVFASDSNGRYSFRPMAFDSSAGFSPFDTGLSPYSKIILEYTKTN